MTPPECADIFAKLSEFIDGELPTEVCEKMRDHIADCGPCVEFVESLRKSIALAKAAKRDLPPIAIPDECRNTLLAAYLEKLPK
jgi:anti-sigma factor RsiW